jgi:hypothetical protein
MFRGEKAVRFCSDLPETTVLQKVGETLGSLGRVGIDRKGIIDIEPAEEFHSFLTETAMAGMLRKRWNEYEVRIGYLCRPSRANWAIMILGTLTLLVGWLAVFAPLSVKKKVAHAVRQTLHEVGDEVGGAMDRRFGRLEEAASISS